MSNPIRPPFDDEDPTIAVIRRFMKGHVDQAFLKQYGAHSAGIGQRRSRTSPRGELCLVLYVLPGMKRSPPGSKGDIENPIRWTDPATGQSVAIPTDIVEAKMARMDARHGRIPATKAAGRIKGAGRIPATKGAAEGVPGGASCVIKLKRQYGLDSTLGGWVWDCRDNTLVLLSNHHCLTNDNAAVVLHPAGQEVTSSGKAPKRLGKVKRGALVFDGRVSIDGAIGSIDHPSRAELSVKEIGPAVMAIGPARPGLYVEKVGMKTNHTFGIIDYVNWCGNLDDGAGNPVWFTDCIAIASTLDSPWSDVGDSGSLVFSRTPLPNGSGIKPVVALHCGSTPEGDGFRLGIACRIDWVFEALELATLPSGLFSSLLNALQAGDESQVTIGEDGSSAGPNGTLVGLRALNEVPTTAAASRGTITEETIFALRERLRGTELGLSLLEIVDRHRAELVSLLIKDLKLRAAAVDVLRPMFGGAGPLSDVLDRPVAAEVDRATRRLADLIRKKGSGHLSGAVDACLRQFPAVVDGSRVSEWLNLPGVSR